MGRGLSELQKIMLKMCMDEKEIYRKQRQNSALVESPTTPEEVENNYRISKDWNWFGSVYYKDVLIKVYGWTPGPDGHFSKKEIGIKRYMAAYIAVRKATERLEKRGLIFTGRRDYSLSSKGEAILSAKL